MNILVNFLVMNENRCRLWSNAKLDL